MGGGVGAVGAGAAVGAVMLGPLGALMGGIIGGAGCAIGKGVEYGIDAVKSQYRDGEEFIVRIKMDAPKTQFAETDPLYKMGLTSVELTSPWPAQSLRGYKGEVVVYTYKKVLVEFFDDDTSHGSVQWQLPGRHTMSYGGTSIAKLKITSLD